MGRRVVRTERVGQPQQAVGVDWSRSGPRITSITNFAAGRVGSNQSWSPSGTGVSVGAANGEVGVIGQGAGGFSASNPVTIATPGVTPFAVLLRLRLNSTGQTNKYALIQRDATSQAAIIYGFVAGTFEFYAESFTGSNPRTGSGIAINDTATHTLIYSYDGSTWAGYCDGRRIFSVSRTFSLPTGALADGRILRSDAGDFLGATAFAHVTFGGGLSDAAALALSANPWQLFEPQTRSINIAAVTSIYRPSSDISTGGWTATPGGALFSCIDEAAPDDADFITSPNLSDPSVLGISPSLPAGTWDVRVRAQRTASSGQIRVRFLDSGSVDVGGTGWQTLTATRTNYTLSATTSATADRFRIEVQA